jgi:magnesium transporter
MSEGKASAAQVVTRLCRPESDRCEHVVPERISDLLQEPGTLLWVDIRDPGPAEIEMLREEFGFHRLALEDIAQELQRPKVDEYPGYFLVVLYAPLTAPAGDLPPAKGRESDGVVQTVEVDLLVGSNYVVSVSYGVVPSLEEASRRWEQTDPELRANVGFLLHTIADSLVDSYFPIVDSIEDRLDLVELGLFREGSDFDAAGLLTIKRSLFTLRRAVYPMREVFNVFLRRDQSLFSPETLPYFQDVYDHVLRLLDVLDIQRDMAAGALEAQLGVISNRLNETMQRLTLVAICVGILGAIFGAWGMNFTKVPLDYLGLRGFFIVSGSALSLVALTLLWARRLGLW